MEEMANLINNNYKSIDENIHEGENICTKFEQMNLKKNVLRGIFAYGFETPSSIQQKAIPIIKTGRDLIAQAQSGTGKTAAFSVSVLENIDTESNNLQAIIVSPTRELSEQIYNVISQLGQYTSVRFSLILGGQTRRTQQYNMEQTQPHCIICTPGRINDFIESRIVNVSNIKCLILDEADELLHDAFLVQIKYIITSIPENAQICLFSATMSNYCLDVAKKFLNEPRSIHVKKEQLTLEGISQYYIVTENDNIKYNTILDLYSSIIINQLIIYCNTKHRVMYLKNNLVRDGYSCACIHGELSTIERIQIMQDFRKGDVRVLISTDLLSRGIDVQQVSLVINYDVPKNIESYIHRIGRSGRYGRRGIALNLISKYDSDVLNELERFYNTQINELPSDIESVFGSVN
tara:strand:+ start:4827 stop:6044 length:1218 start_codon:yes stop_codon:yes gene_type:complete